MKEFFSSDQKTMKKLTVKITFTEDVLGTASNNAELHADYIASKAPDADSKVEEIEAIGVDAMIEKGMTVFPRDKNGNPIYWDYQVKGFFKDTCSGLQRCKGQSYSKQSCSIRAYKKVIDNTIFTYPRQIKIHLSGAVGNLQRPLRAQTAQGERIAIADSETIPAKSWFVVSIVCLADESMDAVIEWLNYGRVKGMGQWRNAGYGRFTYQIIEESYPETFEEAEKMSAIEKSHLIWK